MPYPVAVPAPYLPHAVGLSGAGDGRRASVDSNAMDYGASGARHSGLGGGDNFSDGDGSHGVPSVPSSAASSSVHLPLVGGGGEYGGGYGVCCF
ncbi:hypothetical protein D9613_008193 [Agrocybe pediades]|uniref:Uncharacterized protein n=1 Tax=Agrocybe pediades TaxID=84607 RepID=A0A8H4VJU5_9AGAR|nr:hypothetical protein D9613_008193 [Agrocybe pediades]